MDEDSGDGLMVRKMNGWIDTSTMEVHGVLNRHDVDS